MVEGALQGQTSPAALAYRGGAMLNFAMKPSEKGSEQRSEREFGAVAASRINGYAYCAAVHAKRFTELTKRPEVMQRIERDGADAALEPRLQAILDYAAKLTRDPAAITGADAEPLRRQGLGDLEILDLTHAVAMFAWANRLMQTLGEPVTPGGSC